MKSGWWINTRSGKAIVIDEHEHWIRRSGNADKLGVPKRVQADFGKFKPVKDRNEFLLHVMRKAPAMRVRGHGTFATFEYAQRSRRDAMDAIWLWGLKNAGEYTGMRIVNFSTNEKVEMRWGEFKKIMESDGPDGVMRAASAERLEVRPEVDERIAVITGKIAASDDPIHLYNLGLIERDEYEKLKAEQEETRPPTRSPARRKKTKYDKLEYRGKTDKNALIAWRKDVEKAIIDLLDNAWDNFRTERKRYENDEDMRNYLWKDKNGGYLSSKLIMYELLDSGGVDFESVFIFAGLDAKKEINKVMSGLARRKKIIKNSGRELTLKPSNMSFYSVPRRFR